MKNHPFYSPLFRIVCLFGLVLCLSACRSDSIAAEGGKAEERIRIEENRFVRDGKPIWLSGANTPWHRWEAFGGNSGGERMDPEWWDAHFAKLAEIGVNNTRVWLSCNGYQGVEIRDDGYVVGPTPAFWEDVDRLMEIARRHRIYVMAGLISFDHTKEGNPRYEAWRNLYASRENMDSFAENYAVPLVRRYRDNPWLFSIDICNEILWMSDTERPETDLVPWENLQYLVARTAQRVHEESEVLVSVSNYLKYTSPRYEGNKWSDEALRAVVDDPQAYLDFYKIHYYGWCYPHFGFHLQATPEQLGMGDKPAITGEISALGAFRQIRSEDGTRREVLLMSLAEAYRLSLQNGWQGIQPWTSNGVDIHGDWRQIAEASVPFAENHPELVDPTSL